MKTTDLCDKYGDQLRVAEPIGFRSFGGRSEFHGQIETVQCFEDNTFVRATLEKEAPAKSLWWTGTVPIAALCLGITSLI